VHTVGIQSAFFSGKTDAFPPHLSFFSFQRETPLANFYKSNLIVNRLCADPSFTFI